MKKAFILIAIFSVFILNIVPCRVEAKTLAQLRGELRKWESELSKNTGLKNKTKNEISTAQSNITFKQNQITTNQNKMEAAAKESTELESEIKNGKKELEKILNAYQVAEGSNVYLEYVFDSASYEELVYRYAVMEQIMDYINDKIDGWNSKIEYNKELKIELTNLEAKLNDQIEGLTVDIQNLGKELDKYDDAAMDIQDEIKSTKESIKMYENIGCKENEDLDVCLASKTSKGWVKPLVKGHISSPFGYRINPLTGKGTKFHSGTDIAGNSEGTNVYAVANGKVGKIVRRSSCGGNQVYVYHTVNGKKYTTCYMHLLKILVSVGQEVSINTVVGEVGGGRGTRSYDRCSTGPHLHLGLASGWYGVDYLTYSAYKARLMNAATAMKLPPRGKGWTSRY